MLWYNCLGKPVKAQNPEFRERDDALLGRAIFYVQGFDESREESPFMTASPVIMHDNWTIQQNFSNDGN